jgi:hypothetical protein
LFLVAYSVSWRFWVRAAPSAFDISRRSYSFRLDPAWPHREGDLVFFFLDTVPQLDLVPFYASCELAARWAKVCGEWRLVCPTHNLLKLWRYGCASG